MAITDLTGTKWEINVTPNIPQELLFANVTFKAGNSHEAFIRFATVVSIITYKKLNDNGTTSDHTVYENGAWVADELRFITIESGEDVTKTDFINWLEANATQIIDPPATEQPFLSKTGLLKVWQNILTHLNKKQEKLVSGINLKTVNGQSLLGSGNVEAGFHVAVGQERWVGTYTDENNVTYQVYSKQVYIPALPDTAGVTTYEHGIENIKQILDIYGSTTDGFVLNAPRQTVTDNITIYQASRSASNKTFSIEVGKDRSNKKAYVTVIYAKNN